MILERPRTVAVLGSGSWGTALSVLLAGKGYPVKLWGHKSQDILDMAQYRRSRRYLPGLDLPDTLTPCPDLKEAVTGADVVLVVVPSPAVRGVVAQFITFLQPGCRIVSAVKGIENESLLTMSQVIHHLLCEKLGPHHKIEVGVLSGPSFAEEVAKKVPTAVTLGFANLATARELQQFFVTETFRVYTSRDVIGLEISAAVKNVIAIASGVCEGLGYGLNTRAALITRGLAEMQRLGLALGAESATFSGLSGMGDLILTCTGHLSRNRHVGLRLGQGATLAQIQAEMTMVAEGVKTTQSVYQLAMRHEIDMPILREVYRILYQNKSCDQAVKDLLSRELRSE
jgi:glycerol-3-phosphate dehydrogenase (NAD(P)+)